MIAPEERRHLKSGTRRGEQPGGAGLVSVVIRCRRDARVVLGRCREVLGVVLDHQLGPWPEVDEWRRFLPGWFVDACVEESKEEVERWLAEWRRLPSDQRAAAEEGRGWSLADWLMWLQPDERQWFWWDASVDDEDTLTVELEVVGLPGPLGAFTWLARAAGATAVVVVEDAQA